MARVITPDQAKQLGLPGRISFEIVSGEMGARNTCVRLVEIPVSQEGEKPRGPHVHHSFEECIYVLGGEGRFLTAYGAHPVRQGDTILVPAGEPHVTRNTGSVPLLLLCFFPTADVAKDTEDL
jgi:mannose-6-phosphate isomerase-like protein (cupin superfamily)